MLTNEKIGQGTYGQVLQTTEPDIVCKVSRVTSDLPEDVIREFAALTLLNRLHVPNVPEIKEMKISKNAELYMKKYQKLNLPVENPKLAFVQLLTTIAKAHSLGLAHRDIKTCNILQDNQDFILCDWGLCLKVTHIHKPVYVCGSLWYRPPEICLPCVIVPTDLFAMDIWCLGCTFFELLIGEIMFPGTNTNDQAREIFENRKSQLKKIPYFFRCMIRKMLQINPNTRWTANQCLDYFSVTNVEKNTVEFKYTLDWSKQTDLNYKMREILIDWIYDLCHKFSFEFDILFCAIEILDRFVSHDSNVIKRENLQLVGMGALMIAWKLYESQNAPIVDCFAFYSDSRDAQELVMMEKEILYILKFDLHFSHLFKHLCFFGLYNARAALYLLQMNPDNIPNIFQQIKNPQDLIVTVSIRHFKKVRHLIEKQKVMPKNTGTIHDVIMLSDEQWFNILNFV